LGHSHVGLHFTNEEQKKTGLRHIWQFCSTCQPCLWCHWYRLLNIKWQHSWLCFFSFQSLIFHKQDKKLSEKLWCVYCFVKKIMFVFHRQDQKLSGKIVVSIFYMLFIPILLLDPHASLLQCPLTIRKQKIRPTTGFLIVNIINVHSMCWQGTDWFNWKFIQKIILLHTTTESPFCLKLHFSFQLTYLPKLFSTWYHKTDLSCLTFTQLSWITLRHHS